MVALTEFLVNYDLADPADPTVSQVIVVGEHEQSRWFSTVGTSLFCIDQGSTLRVFDATDSLALVDLGSVTLAGDRIEAMVAGNDHLHLLVASCADPETILELVTYEVRDSLAPTMIANAVLATELQPTDCFVTRVDDLLLAVPGDGRVLAFGLADPASPAVGWEIAHETDRVVVSEGRIFVDTQATLFVYPRTDHLTPPEAPVERDKLPRLQAVAGRGDVQLVQDYLKSELLAPLDVSNPRHPVVGRWVDMSLDGDLHWAEGVALLKHSITGKCQLVDLTDPAQPRKAGSWSYGGDMVHRAVISSTKADLRVVRRLRHPGLRHHRSRQSRLHRAGRLRQSLLPARRSAALPPWLWLRRGRPDGSGEAGTDRSDPSDQ